MHRIYVYELKDPKKLKDILDFSHQSDIEYDDYRQHVCFRVPAGASHSMFLMRFSSDVRLVDKTWEIG